MEELARHWYQMEFAVRRYLDRLNIPYVGEGVSVGGDSSSDDVMYDFIVTGRVPTFIEIKYARFGNVSFTKDLARTAVQAFNRSRFVLIVVGAESEDWQPVSPFVSTTRFFDPMSFDVADMNRAADDFIAELFCELHGLRQLSRNDAFWETEQGGIDSLGLDFGLPPLQAIFQHHIPECITTVASSFTEMMGPDSPSSSVIRHELSRLRTELESGHHTACALRIGRCLELCVYAFAHRLDIPLMSGQYKSMMDVQSKISQLNREMDEFGGICPLSDAARYSRKRESLAKRISATQSALGLLSDRLDGIHADERAVFGPDNLQTILRRGRRRLKHRDSSVEARERLGQVVKKNQVKELSDFRNAAAHGDPDFQTRETTYAEVVDKLFVLAEFVQELVNIIDIATQHRTL